MKRKLEQVEVSRKLRSALPRRRRSEISPIIFSGELKNLPKLSKFEKLEKSPIIGDSISNLTKENEVSCGSVNNNNNKIERVITRLYAKKREIEVSENSCVDSCSNLTVEVKKAEIKLNKLEKLENKLEFEGETESDYSSANKSFSEISTAKNNKLAATELLCDDAESNYPAKFLPKLVTETELKPENHNTNSTNFLLQLAKPEKTKPENSISNSINLLCTESEYSTADFLPKLPKSVAKTQIEAENNNANSINLLCTEPEYSTADFLPKIPNPQTTENDYTINSINLLCNEHLLDESEYSTADFLPKIPNPENNIPNSINLLCTEQLNNNANYESASSYYSSSAFSDLVSSSSEYTPSMWLSSGSEFSEKSFENSTPSPTYSLFLQLSNQFCRSTVPLGSNKAVSDDNDFTMVPILNEEDELSYAMLRSRERKEMYMRDYAEEYCSATDYGHLVIQQRLQMVHWIIEQATSKELQKETMFLGVSLLDRFLSKGFFKNKRNLQVAGIACLALATRIEENQPFNSVRKRTFSVGGDMYSRCEVVAMEWLILEVLNFQCFMPTINNFLWFYLKAAEANEEVEKVSKYLAVLALLGHEQLCFWPSTVAAGLVILASLSASQDIYCSRVVETHVRTKDDDLSGCLKSLEWLVKYA